MSFLLYSTDFKWNFRTLNLSILIKDRTIDYKLHNLSMTVNYLEAEETTASVNFWLIVILGDLNFGLDLVRSSRFTCLGSTFSATSQRVINGIFMLCLEQFDSHWYLVFFVFFFHNNWYFDKISITVMPVASWTWICEKKRATWHKWYKKRKVKVTLTPKYVSKYLLFLPNFIKLRYLSIQISQQRTTSDLSC